nr:VWA-like domain-containing protein [Actibacterium sp. 188UL27-1]
MEGGPQPIYEPGTRATRDAPRVAVGIDMSSSVDDALLARFAAEIRNITARYRAETHILPFDDVVLDRIRVLPGAVWTVDLMPTDIARGGGTSFIDVIETAAQLEASIAVVLTDLDGPSGPKPRTMPVLWAVPQDPVPPCPFGRVVSLAR